MDVFVSCDMKYVDDVVNVLLSIENINTVDIKIYLKTGPFMSEYTPWETDKLHFKKGEPSQFVAQLDGLDSGVKIMYKLRVTTEFIESSTRKKVIDMISNMPGVELRSVI